VRNYLTLLNYFIFYSKHPNFVQTAVPYYDINGAWKATVFATPPSKDSLGIIIAFNESTGDLITGDKQKKLAFERFKDENYLGGKDLMLKWSTK
jgi:hypothetical protein